ncbi:helix-turn-helix domain-containing protein [Mycolicibacterium wolinskyi]|uniref:helix-turn-helix domain-containing protein n=1 Tax=Mycolicibacterium TaxID=1866885 RepID=UPI0010547A49|nr:MULTISPECIES: helix-turn-helix domain-containing protein [Mycolicibacterium]MCV7287274.1 helix-turn-helix domain-containing protein [Mycolicibacterium wolinskyi]MCV7292767.1 helix-turn-helix domain-containing protein [Mycolicibacterium goodii]
MTQPRHPAPSLEVRIAQRITSDGSAIIPPRIARWLNEQAGMTADRRIKLRDTDPDAYVAFAALHLSALRSDCGTNTTARQQNTTHSDMWMSTKEAAQALNVTDRCVRKWCTTGRLHAEFVGARWLVNPNSIALIA